MVQSLAASQGRPIADVDRDLAQVQRIARLIDAVYISTRIDSQATATERSIGIMLHPLGGESASKP